jgi:DNA replication protein
MNTVLEEKGDGIQHDLTRLMRTLEQMTPEERIIAQERNRKQKEANRASQVETLRSEMHAPTRHMDTQGVREGKWGEKIAKLEQRLGTGFTVAIVGLRGTGKTQMAVDLMKVATERFMSARFLTAVEFFMEVKATFRKESVESDLDIIKRYRKPKLLVIDEIGKRSDSAWENTLLFELLNKRYNDKTDTLLIDNRSEKEFAVGIGASLASRIAESGGLINCDWESFR